MTEKTPNINLKSIKVRPSIHREIKMESVERDENIEDTVERAWRAYRPVAQSPRVEDNIEAQTNNMRPQSKRRRAG